jgi:hypothetical protein
MSFLLFYLLEVEIKPLKRLKKFLKKESLFVIDLFNIFLFYLNI